MENINSEFNLVRIIIQIILVTGIIAGLILLSDSMNNEDSLSAVINSLMILVSFITFVWVETITKADRKEVEQLRTEIALLQNRIEYIEDDMSKEQVYVNETP